MTLTANWSYPTAIRFGAGRLAELAEHCRSAGMKRPLMVTDRQLAKLPIVQRALDLLDAAGLGKALFSDVDPNPTEKNLDAGLRVFREGGHDGVVAMGGGSGLDLGKAIAFMSGQTRPVWDFEDVDDWWTRARPEGIAPSVAIPTTSGTGSEVGRASVITNSETHTKKIIFHPRILPAVTICDPELTVGLPPALTAGTGFDAFIHCLEAYCSPFYHPMSQGIAVEGMRLVKEYLARAYRNGADIEARANLMAASAMGAVAFQKGLGGIHALSHPIGAIYGTHHGTTNAVVMPAVLRFNRSAIEDRIESLASYLRIRRGFDGFYEYMMNLRAELGIPDRLGMLGVDGEKAGLIAEMAVNDPSAGGNPIPLTVEAARSLFIECI
jgi:alcohol dehydrogenase